MMPWVKLDDRFFTNPKVIRAGRDARDLYLAGLCYCAAELTDGFIPEGAIPLLYVMGGVTPLPDDYTLITRLLHEALWESAEGGFCVHDYLDYNPSAAQVKRERASNARRVQEWRTRHPDFREQQRNAPRNGVRNARVTPPPSPSPIDTPSPTEKVARDADAPAPSAPVRGNQKVAAVIDALRAEGMTGTLTAKDRAAIVRTEHDPLEVARLYAAIFEGEYGDDFMHDNLSVWLCLEKLPGWLSHRAGHRAPARNNGKPLSGSAAVDAVFKEALSGHRQAERGERGGRRGAGVGDQEAGGGLPPLLPG